MLLHLGEQRALDVEVLRDGLDDPVAVGDERQVVVEVARGDEARGVGDIERRRLGFFQRIDRGQGELVALGLRRGIGGRAGRDDVQQHDRHAGVGDVRRDARAHGPGAEHRYFANLPGLACGRMERRYWTACTGLRARKKIQRTLRGYSEWSRYSVAMLPSSEVR